MEVATGVAGRRSLSGVRATRIVEAMRDSVAEVGIAGSTFERPELQRELGELYRRARAEFAEILREKERDGVVKLRFGPEATLAYLFGAGDGLTVQRLTDPSLDVRSTMEAAVGVAHWLLSAER